MRTILLSMAVMLIAACSTTRTFPLSGSSAVPAAQGQVAASVGENGNTRLDIEVRHLAEPSKLSPGATQFVAWAQPTEPGTQPQSLGALNVDSDLTGRLQTVTPLKNFTLLISPERPGTTQWGSTTPVLTAHISRSE